jgi:tRNA(Arg) A34 adenosine deaminase TadA
MVEHHEFIRECHRLAIEAGKNGDEPFGAVLVRGGEIIMRAANTVNTQDDTFQHAEYRLVLQARKELSEEVVAESTLYSSTAPCVLCSGAILSTTLAGVVYSVGYEAFGGRGRPHVSIDDLAARLRPEMFVLGSVLEDEGMKAYEWWAGEFTPLEQLLSRWQ